MHSSCRFARILMLSQILNFFLWVKSDVELSAMALLHWVGHLTCTELKPIEVDAVCNFGVLCQFKSSPHRINQEANTLFLFSMLFLLVPFKIHIAHISAH